MFKKTIWLSVVILIALSVHAESKIKEGEYKGAKTATHPAWFKDSFLNLEEDIADAAKANKRLVIYFWQPGCPYCNQLWEDNFSQQEILDTFKDNFEIVALNMWGDREVVSVAGNNYTEKSFAEALQIQYTPTLLFFNKKKKVIHQLNGYIPPEDFIMSLKYVAGKHEKTQRFADYTLALKEKQSQKGELHKEDFYTPNKLDLSNIEKPYLAVFFESKNCKNCDLLHQKTLQDKTTRDLVTQFESVQFDRFANTSITTPNSNKTNIKEWANELNISYLPATLFFNKAGKEVMRINAQMRTFHTQSVYDYVLSGAYKTELNFQRYISARSEKIRAQGIDVDIWAY